MKHVVMFRPVFGFDNYEIDQSGHIRRGNTHVFLTGWVDGGYQHVELRRDGQSHKRKVHRLVLESHIGPQPEQHEACHRNGDGLDNRLENLYWGTRQQNMIDKVRHGHHHNSIKTHCKRGHEFDGQNTKLVIQGTWKIRQCRACNCERARARRLQARTLRGMK